MNEGESKQEATVSTTSATSSSYIMNAFNSITRDEKKDRLRSWLGRFLRIFITDGRCLVGRFVCTDRDGNTILESTWEYTDVYDSKLHQLNCTLILS